MARGGGPRNAADDFLDERVELTMGNDKFDPEKAEGAKGHKPDLIARSGSHVFVRRGEEVATAYAKDSGGGYTKLPAIPARSDGTVLVGRTVKAILERLPSSLNIDWTYDPGYALGSGISRLAPTSYQHLKNIIERRNFDALEEAGIFTKMAASDPEFFRTREKFLVAFQDIAGAATAYDDYDTLFGQGRGFNSKLTPESNHFVQARENGRDWDNDDTLEDVDIDELFVCEDSKNKKSLAVTAEGDRLFLLDWSKSDATQWEVKELDIGDTDGKNAITGIGTDPNDRFIFVARGRTLSVIDYKTDPAIEVGSMNHPNPRVSFEGHIRSSGNGIIDVGDSQGHLWSIHSNDNNISGDDKRRALATNLGALREAQRVRASAGAQVGTALDAKVEETQDSLLAKFAGDIKAAKTFKEIRELRADLQGFKQDTLLPLVGDARLVETSTAKITEAINERERAIAQEQADELYMELEKEIKAVGTFEEADAVKGKVEARVKQICEDVADQNLWTIVRSTSLQYLQEQETKVGVKAISREQQAIRDALANIGALDIPSLVKLRAKAEDLERRARTANLKSKDLAAITTLTAEFARQSLDILKKDEDVILKGLDTVMGELKVSLDQVTTPAEFDRWLNSDLPLCRDQLASYQLVIPISHTRVRAKILEIMRDLSKLVAESKVKFEAQYEQTRMAVVEHVEEKSAMANTQIDELQELLEGKVNRKEFANGQAAQDWVDAHPSMATIEKLITDIEAKVPDEAKKLRRKLKGAVSQLVFRVDRLNEMVVDEATGAQMYPFGKMLFPIWEHKTAAEAAKMPTRVELTIQTVGTVSGRAQTDMCELAMKITDGDGNVTDMPLYADDLRKYGLLKDDYSGHFPSYITVAQARRIVNKVGQMDSPGSAVQVEMERFQTELKALNTQLKPLMEKQRALMARKRVLLKKQKDLLEKKQPADANLDAEIAKLDPEIAKFDPEITKLKADRGTLLTQYMNFINDNGLYAWYKLHGVQSRTKQAVVEKNGNLQGAIPEWQWYWTVDESTEHGLESFAREAARQLRLKAGIVSLEGHPGTGKDVIIDMFCNKTRRPKFTFDCSKWSTEYDLSENVQFKSEDGATQTVLVPSVVVEALKTPGAVLYFNEFNALPLATQIFLHSLFDAKRQITLKTSKDTVPAEEGVLICGSLNPNYPGTNTPQAATRDRMVVVPVAYPAFERKDATNRVIGYEASEALRIARSTKSLEDLTEEQDLKKNDFVQLWEEYINKRNTADPRLNVERQYDMDVIFALVQFTNEIRKAFITKIDGTATGPGDFELSQPFTGRGLRICADYLSYDVDKKVKTQGDPEYVSPEKMAKDLLRKYYFPYIVDGEQKAQFTQKLDAEWTMRKP